MYIPPYFREERLPVLHDFMREHPLATLVTIGPDGMSANHLPLMVMESRDPYGSLVGHVARGNPVWKTADTPALVIFSGPEHYISPNWYASKQEHGRVVPTWNYSAVHVHGVLRIHDNRDWLLNLVTRLTGETHERQFEAPWKVSDAPAEYVEGLLKGIVGIEIPIDRIEGKWKMGAESGRMRIASVRARRCAGRRRRRCR